MVCPIKLYNNFNEFGVSWTFPTHKTIFSLSKVIAVDTMSHFITTSAITPKVAMLYSLLH